MNGIYDTFVRTLTDIYDANLPIPKSILKDKDIESSWISKGLKKSSQKKQKSYIKFLKTKTLEDEFKYKTYKSLFEKPRKKAKTTCYSKLLRNYKTDSKRTWQVMKEITGKQNQIFSPTKLKLTKPIYKINKTLVKNSTNFLLLLNQNWWKKFQDILTSHNQKLQFEELNFDEFEEAFQSSKWNKVAGFETYVATLLLMHMIAWKILSPCFEGLSSTRSIYW